MGDKDFTICYADWLTALKLYAPELIDNLQ